MLYLFASFCTFTPVMIAYARSYWNPYFMLPTSMLLLALLVKGKYTVHNSKAFFVFIGFLFGLGFQYHYSFILAIGVSLAWLIIHKKINVLAFLFVTGGFILGFLPIIVFELRNHFYLTQTLLYVFGYTQPGKGGFVWHDFYFISLYPFLFFFFAWFLVKVLRIKQVYIYGVVFILCCWSIYTIITAQKYIFNYPMVQKVATIITQDKPKDFNIVDQLTRDNRAMALRYILTVHGFEPHNIVDYQSPQTLYIYSKEPLKTLLVHPIWEIKSFLPFQRVKTWQLDKDIYLYKLEK